MQWCSWSHHHHVMLVLKHYMKTILNTTCVDFSHMPRNRWFQCWCNLWYMMLTPVLRAFQKQKVLFQLKVGMVSLMIPSTSPDGSIDDSTWPKSWQTFLWKSQPNGQNETIDPAIGVMWWWCQCYWCYIIKCMLYLIYFSNLYVMSVVVQMITLQAICGAYGCNNSIICPKKQCTSFQSFRLWKKWYCYESCQHQMILMLVLVASIIRKGILYRISIIIVLINAVVLVMLPALVAVAWHKQWCHVLDFSCLDLMNEMVLLTAGSIPWCKWQHMTKKVMW